MPGVSAGNPHQNETTPSPNLPATDTFQDTFNETPTRPVARPLSFPPLLVYIRVKPILAPRKNLAKQIGRDHEAIIVSRGKTGLNIKR